MIKPTVVFVCTGNTCRSPLAMVSAARRWGDRVAVESAGLQAIVGDSATDGARDAAREHGLDLDGHRARRVHEGMLGRPGWIIGMTRSHVAQMIHHVAPDGMTRLGLLGAPGLDLRHHAAPDAVDVPDPFGGDEARYRDAAAQIDRLVAAWTEFVRPRREDEAP